MKLIKRIIRQVKFDFKNGSDVKMGEDVCFNRFCSVHVYKGGRLRIGNNVHFSQGCIISCHKELTIGDDVIVGHYAFIGDGDHTNKPKWVNGKIKSKPVKIGNNVWIGTKATILKGSRIEDNAVVGANTVVSNKKIEKGEVYTGKSKDI